MELFPAMPLEEWADTKETLHRFAQIVGKIRLEKSQRRNHWWHVPFHLTGRGITTRPMGGLDGDPLFCIDFDFVGHLLVVSALDGRTAALPLAGRSVAEFHRDLFAALDWLGVDVEILGRPYGLHDDIPFAEDTVHAGYDPEQAGRYWQVLSQVAQVLDRYAAGYCGKTSPVHHFWHTLDIAVTRFSGREAEVDPGADQVTREAYSREVISAGFWFGDTAMPWPAFYSYTAPEPAGLAGEPLVPERAAWLKSRGGHLAVLRYDDARSADDPVQTVVSFLDSAFLAGARLARWDLGYRRCPGGVTDPVLRPAVAG
ncbi:hypothetical protein DPM19_12990 [Actinomadura craniellae]|uniref:Ava_C0101 and related proteins n=1 Tax=Actinomadura craniellae TaxID=2231787 RepID=A0A365H6F7_9ACTN|nr:DUF5996 family protein [Actinomadura craniellae]RAY14667.1 hypothetical protein DPM19_12990 [Actinomadura craniellae]